MNRSVSTESIRSLERRHSDGSLDPTECIYEHYGAEVARYAMWRYLVQSIRSNNHTDACNIYAILERYEVFWGMPGLEKMKELGTSLKGNDGHAVEFQDEARAMEIASTVLNCFTVHLSEDNNSPHFDVLFIQEPGSKSNVAAELSLVNKGKYTCLVATSFIDALVAILFNHNIQAVVTNSDFPIDGRISSSLADHLLALNEFVLLPAERARRTGAVLTTFVETVGRIRPELDFYLVTEYSVSIASYEGRNFDRVFASMDDHTELHHTILQGINRRHHTPFFSALEAYSERPIGVFHALPCSRGNSILKSRWIQEILRFYGRNLFCAESSSTCGGLDSLLNPEGALKQAQAKAATAYGAQFTFFVTNGTSTANKVVLQSLIRPGDIALIDRDCHKSHHYALVLNGANPCYLDAYPLTKYSMYGGVPLALIKKTLLYYKSLNMLHKVKTLILTNCTFDGIVYNVLRVMEECLAIHPDLVFIWDEAWFAFATFNPVYRTRTGLGAARTLKQKLSSELYKREFEEFVQTHGHPDTMTDEKVLNTRMIPDPEKAATRVYVTQSTHKSLTALRQGSMIHVFDQFYGEKVAHAFHEAYYTHTSTSPNYQILASLDISRAQMELEGYLMVNDTVEHAMALRRQVALNPRMSNLFPFLDICDLIPEQYRACSGVQRFFDVGRKRFTRLETAWFSDDEFVLDPTRLTMFTGLAGLEGDAFKVKWLMDKHQIQVNKTSRNSVLFQTNIGTTSSSVGYLLQCLEKCSKELIEEREHLSPQQRKLMEARLRRLTVDLPALPPFSGFHPAFLPRPDAMEGDMRDAYFLAYDESQCTYITPREILTALARGETFVSSSFVTPYPPGFPILVPGQVISPDIVHFLMEQDVKEIHGFLPDLGLRVFVDATLTARLTARTAHQDRYRELASTLTAEELAVLTRYSSWQ